MMKINESHVRNGENNYEEKLMRKKLVSQN